MKKNDEYIKKAEEYIDFIIKSDLEGNKLLKREYPEVIEHDNSDLIIAEQIYKDLKKMCIEYKKGLVNDETISEFCANVMYKKYSPKGVSKIVADEIYDAMDYISELSFLKKDSTTS